MKVFLSVFISILISIAATGQDTIPEPAPEKVKKPIKDKLFYGGSIGVTFGSYSRIAVYPYIGLKLTKNLRAAFQVGYEYISDTRGSTDYNASNYGFSILARYNIIPAIYVHLEPAYYSFDAYYLSDQDRVWVPFLFAGAGLHKSLGNRSAIFVQVKFDLIQDSNSPYKDWAPFFDIGVSVGI